MIAIEGVFFGLIMLYAMACVASAWSWGRRRGIPDGLLGLFAVALPVAGWLFGTFFPWAALITPFSLGGLWGWASSHEKEWARRKEEDEALRREAVFARLASAPDDGVALLEMAEILERERHWSAALRHYEAAHRASDRLFNASQLDETRERLLEAEARVPPPRGREALLKELTPLDWAAVILAGLHVVSSPPQSAAAISAVLFAAWLRLGQDGRPSSAA